MPTLLPSHTRPPASFYARVKPTSPQTLHSFFRVPIFRNDPSPIDPYPFFCWRLDGWFFFSPFSLSGEFQKFKARRLYFSALAWTLGTPSPPCSAVQVALSTPPLSVHLLTSETPSAPPPRPTSFRSCSFQSSYRSLIHGSALFQMSVYLIFSDPPSFVRTRRGALIPSPRLVPPTDSSRRRRLMALICCLLGPQPVYDRKTCILYMRKAFFPCGFADQTFSSFFPLRSDQGARTMLGRIPTHFYPPC